MYKAKYSFPCVRYISLLFRKTWICKPGNNAKRVERKIIKVIMRSTLLLKGYLNLCCASIFLIFCYFGPRIILKLFLKRQKIRIGQ